MTVRVGVIGTGFGARVVAPVFRETPGCEVVDVVSSRDDAAVAELCDRADVDLVSVHSPPFLHAAHVRRALSREHAVLCDKPFGVDARDAEMLTAAAEAAECVHLVNFEFRHDPMRRLLRELVQRRIGGQARARRLDALQCRFRGAVAERTAGCSIVPGAVVGWARGAPTSSTRCGGCSARWSTRAAIAGS